MADKIIIKGAKEHNLKNVDLVLPRNKFIVFTGLSGRTEKVCGKFVLICQTVLGTNGQARCGIH